MEVDVDMFPMSPPPFVAPRTAPGTLLALEPIVFNDFSMPASFFTMSSNSLLVLDNDSLISSATCQLLIAFLHKMNPVTSFSNTKFFNLS